MNTSQLALPMVSQPSFSVYSFFRVFEHAVRQQLHPHTDSLQACQNCSQVDIDPNVFKKLERMNIQRRDIEGFLSDMASWRFSEGKSPHSAQNADVDGR